MPNPARREPNSARTTAESARATVIKVKSIQKSSSTVTVAIDSYTGHSYQLQKIPHYSGRSWLSNLGLPQQGSTRTVPNFNDSATTEGKDYYRIVSPNWLGPKNVERASSLLGIEEPQAGSMRHHYLGGVFARARET